MYKLTKPVHWLHRWFLQRHSRAALIKMVIDEKIKYGVLLSQLQELVRNARPVINCMDDDENWGGLNDCVTALYETIEFLDEEHPEWD